MNITRRVEQSLPPFPLKKKAKQPLMLGLMLAFAQPAFADDANTTAYPVDATATTAATATTVEIYSSTSSNAVNPLFKFEIKDLGTSDELPTQIEQLVIDVADQTLPALSAPASPDDFEYTLFNVNPPAPATMPQNLGVGAYNATDGTITFGSSGTVLIELLDGEDAAFHVTASARNSSTTGSALYMFSLVPGPFTLITPTPTSPATFTSISTTSTTNIDNFYNIEANIPPTTSLPTITGTPEFESALTASATPADSDGTASNAFVWYVSPTNMCPTIGSTPLYNGTTFTPTADEIGKYLCVEATPTDDDDDDGVPKTSAAVGPVATLGQTITFNATASYTYEPNGEGSYTATAVPTGSVDVTVDLGATNTANCSVSSTGAFTYSSVGECTLLANKPAITSSSGIVTHTAATQQSQTITVTKANQTITFDAATSQIVSDGGEVSITTLNSDSELDVILAIDTLSPGCTISSATPIHKVLGTSTGGACNLIASQSGNGNYNAASNVSKTINITLNEDPSIDEVLITPSQGVFGEALSATPTNYTDPESHASAAHSVEWTRSTTNNCVASDLTSDPVITALSTSTTYTPVAEDIGMYLCATITPVDELDGKGEPKNTVIGPIAPASQSVNAVATSTSLVYGQTATVSDSVGSGTVTFSTSSTNNCEVDMTTGEVTAKESGPCVIEVTKSEITSNGIVTHPEATDSILIDITAATQNVIAQATATSIMMGSTSTVSDSVGGGDITFNTNATSSICDVDSDGVVTPKAVGDCVVEIIKAGTTNQQLEARDTITIRVSAASQTVLANATATTIPFDGQTIVFDSVGNLAGGSVAEFTSTGSCDVDSASGLVTPNAVGSCTVTVTKEDSTTLQEASDSVVINVVPVTQNVQAITNQSSIHYDQTAVVSDAIGHISGGNAATFDTTGACTVQSNGLVEPSAIGPCVVTATKFAVTAGANPATHSAVSSSVLINISKAPQSISFPAPADQMYALNGSFSTDVTSVTGSPNVSVDAAFSTAGCSIDPVTNVVSYTSAGICSLTAIMDETTLRLAAEPVHHNVTILAIDQTISFIAPDDQTIPVGNTLVSPTLMASSGLTPNLSSSTPSVCTVSGLTITVTGAGACTLTAEQAGSNNYNAALSISRTVYFNATAPVTGTTDTGGGGSWSLSWLFSLSLLLLFARGRFIKTAIVGGKS